MRYAKFLGSGVLVKPKDFDGAKIYKEIPYRERADYKGIRVFIETEDEIIADWDYIELTEEEKMERRELSENVDEIELASILMGGGTE